MDYGTALFFFLLQSLLAHQGMLQAVALAFKDNQLSMVGESVNHRGSHLVIGKDRAHLENSRFVVRTRLRRS